MSQTKTESKKDNMAEVELLFLQGTTLLRDGHVTDAIPYLEQAYELQPSDVDVAINLSGAYILTKKFQKAVKILESAVSEEPDHAMVWINLGAAYLGNPVLARDEEQKRAIAAFERALTIDPVAHSVAYNIGLIYRDRHEKGEAIHWMRQAVKHNPNDRDARNLLNRLEAA
jgi:tetratricopeptide (TPR) repeat protein